MLAPILWKSDTSDNHDSITPKSVKATEGNRTVQTANFQTKADLELAPSVLLTTILSIGHVQY